jgi:uncharacterized protein YdeI (YjbR/CyaY-like superfamily)
MIVKTFTPKSRAQWRSWLAKHHDRETEVWLFFAKKGTGKPTISYDDAVEEALCYGWIDGLVKRVDEIYYKQRFTPRKKDSKWSEINRKRYAKLVEDGLMAEPGRARPPSSKPSGYSFESKPITRLPPYISQALRNNAKARANFENLPPGRRRLYLHWIHSAKKEETRLRRLKEAMRKWEANEPMEMM